MSNQTWVWITWILLAGLVLFEIRLANGELQKNKLAWKFAAHCVLLTLLSLAIVQMGLYCLSLPLISAQVTRKLRPIAARALAPNPARARSRVVQKK